MAQCSACSSDSKRCTVITAPHAELDLKNQAQVNQWFAANKPHAVFLAAAKVGGIVANNTLRAAFLYDGWRIGGDGLGKRYPDLKWDQAGLSETVWKAHNADLQVIPVKTPDELKRAVNEAMDSGKPTLINAVIDPASGSESGRIGNLNPQSALKKK